MPLVRIDVPRRLPVSDTVRISDAVHEALTAAFDVPEQDRFQIVTRHAPERLVCAPEYLGVRHGEHAVIIQITCNEGRTVEMKRALYARLARNIAARTAVPAADVI